MDRLEYPSAYGGTYLVQPEVNLYANNDNLSVSLLSYEKEGDYWEPFCSVTTNIEKLPYLYGAIDTNDNGPQMIAFLEKNGFGESVGLSLHSGFCDYPVFRFNEEKLRRVDPKGFEKYAKAHSKAKPRLADQISSAKANPHSQQSIQSPNRER